MKNLIKIITLVFSMSICMQSQATWLNKNFISDEKAEKIADVTSLCALGIVGLLAIEKIITTCDNKNIDACNNKNTIMDCAKILVSGIAGLACVHAITFKCYKKKKKRC